MLTRCFLEEKNKFWFVYERLKILGRANFYSNTEYADNNFCYWLSVQVIIFADNWISCAIFFADSSVCVKQFTIFERYFTEHLFLLVKNIFLFPVCMYVHVFSYYWVYVKRLLSFYIESIYLKNIEFLKLIQFTTLGKFFFCFSFPSESQGQKKNLLLIPKHFISPPPPLL